MPDGIVDDSHLGTLTIQINHWPQPYKRWSLEIFVVCKYILKKAVLEVQFDTENNHVKEVADGYIAVVVIFIGIMYGVESRT